MTAETVPWTVVNLSADGGPATAGATTLLNWLVERSDVRVHSVVWLPGSASNRPYRVGTFHDVARDHGATLPQLLRRADREGLASKVTARSIRSTLARVPRSGVVFLNGVACAPALRYLPPGDRTVLTRVRVGDDATIEELPAAWVDQMVEETDVWLAADDETRAWVLSSWPIDPAAVEVMDDPLDLASWEQRQQVLDPARLSLAVAGGAWFRSDHTARLVQVLRRLRPDLRIEVVWSDVVKEEHLAPLLHDLEVLGVRDHVHVPASDDEISVRLREADVLALTGPNDHLSWPAWDAAQKGLRVVCFDSHPRSSSVGGEVGGRVVEYLDIAGMAEAVLAIHDAACAGAASRYARGRAELAGEDVRVLGPRLIELAGRARR